MSMQLHEPGKALAADVTDERVEVEGAALDVRLKRLVAAEPRLTHRAGEVGQPDHVRLGYYVPAQILDRVRIWHLQRETILCNTSSVLYTRLYKVPLAVQTNKRRPQCDRPEEKERTSVGKLYVDNRREEPDGI